MRNIKGQKNLMKKKSSLHLVRDLVLFSGRSTDDPRLAVQVFLLSLPDSLSFGNPEFGEVPEGCVLAGQLLGEYSCRRDQN